MPRERNGDMTEIMPCPRERGTNLHSLLLMGATLLYTASVLMPSSLIAGFCGQLGAGGSLMGVAAGIFNGIGILMHPIAGWYIDRLDRKRLAVGGLSALAAGMFLLSAAPSVWVVILARLVSGMGYAFCSIAYATLMASTVPVGQIEAAMGRYAVAQAVGMAVGPNIGLSIQQAFGYRASFLCAAAAACLGVLLTLLSKPTETKGSTSEASLSSGQILRRLLPLACMVILFVVPYSCVTAFLRTVLEGTGVPADGYFMAYAVCMLLARISVRMLLSRWPFLRFWKLGLLGMIAAITLLSLPSQPRTLAAAAGMALSYGMMMVVFQTAAFSAVPQSCRGKAGSVYYMGLDAGSALSPMIAGALLNAVGAERLFSFLYVCPVLAVLLLLVKRPYFTAFSHSGEGRIPGAKSLRKL